MKIIIILCNLFKCISDFGDEIIDKLGDLLERLFDGILSIIMTICWLPFYPFFILNKLLNKSLKFFELNRNYEKNRQAFLKWYRENKKELKQDD
jgi:hypothetical protein